MSHTLPKKGHTLVETLLVIAVIALLTFAVFPNVKTQLQKARDIRRKTDLHLIKNGLEEYYDSMGCFPDALPSCGSDVSIDGQTVLRRTPCDPTTYEGYTYIISESSKGKNKAPECPQWFQLYANLEYGPDPGIDLVDCRFGCGPSCSFNYGVTSTNTKVDTCVVHFVCATGGGQEGSCEAYDDPTLSQCPKVFDNDPTCQYSCGDNKNRCKNASGKRVQQ